MTNEDLERLLAAAAERFWPNVDVRNADECWPWLGGTIKAGRGVMSVKNKNFLATHVSLTLAGRPRHNNLFALHTCDNPPCVNPNHLWWGTCADNARDASSKGRLAFQSNTHCKHGHPFDQENTRYNSRGQRQCRACQRRMKLEHAIRSKARLALSPAHADPEESKRG